MIREESQSIMFFSKAITKHARQYSAGVVWLGIIPVTEPKLQCAVVRQGLLIIHVGEG